MVPQGYPRRDLTLTEQPSAEWTKRKNIIDMALGFTAMMRVFCGGAKAKIEATLEEFFLSLANINTRDDYEACHRSFCQWFTREIRTAEKKLNNGKVQQSQAASYGQAAKVLDIAIKVYVYYCKLPTAEIAERIVPFLHGAVDTPIMEHLKSECMATTIRAKTIKEVDEKAYRVLQSLVLAASIARKIHPVQYDDIMWRQLNRENNPSNQGIHVTAATDAGGHNSPL
jgi:hypothetical protein